MGVFLIGRKIYFQPKFMIGVEAPDFEAELPNGSTFSLDELRKDNLVLLDFWGSWCGPCREENPNLVKLFNDYHGKSFEQFDNFEIVSVAIETREDAWKKAIAADGMLWKYHVIQLDRFQSPIPELYGIKEIPTTYLINTDGRIVGVNMTYEALDSYLKKQLSTK